MQPDNLRMRLDGDTFRCQGNVEPIIPDSRMWVPKVRLVRVNAPETGETGAEEARIALIDWLRAKPFNLICYARDKYGRLLADAEAGQGLLSDYMLLRGLVAPMGVDKARSLLVGESEALVMAVAHTYDTA